MISPPPPATPSMGGGEISEQKNLPDLDQQLLPQYQLEVRDRISIKEMLSQYRHSSIAELECMGHGNRCHLLNLNQQQELINN